ncbi:MAG TPA: hypothetical protein VHA54_01160 [Solirubrobacterales bacterium]|nr:hypothetical protein [Solirubrobacterales bacterium]
MRRARALLALTVALVAATGAKADPADAATVDIVDLRVDGGEGWHRLDQFRLDWGFAGAGAVAAVDFRVRAADGTTVLQRRIPWATPGIESFRLPADGSYLAEVWTEDALGVASLPATAVLRLDRAQPGTVMPQLPPGWIAGGDAVHLRLSHPGGPTPLSGIRGYAVSIDLDPEGSPCAAEWCEEREVDLRAGAEGDAITFPSLPEGRLYFHAVAVSGSGMRSGQVGTGVLLVDSTAPRVAFDGVPAGWASGPVAVRATATDARSGMAPSDASGAFTAVAVDGGPPSVSRGASSGTVVSGDGVHRLTAFARDAVGNGGGEPAATATVRIDTEPPRVAFADRRDPGDPDRIEATVADSASGPAARGTIGFRPAGSRQRFEPLPTTATAGRLSARWDPTAHPAGTYELRATGYDLAGNAATRGERANGSRMLIVNPRRVETRIAARIVEPGATTAATPGGATVVSGRLSSANGAPVPGREVELTEVFAADAVPQSRAATVRSAPDGTFSLRLAAGPSRRVTLSFAGDRSFAPSTAAPLALEVPSRLRLTVSSPRARIGGRPVVFRGRVASPGASLPRGGLAVALQFRLPGLKWSEFRTVATDARGHFRYPYAFTDDDSRGVRFRFRAVVTEQEGWAYAAGASRPVTVTGR